MKLYCNGCERFYHCHIAGRCIGDNCVFKLYNGQDHRMGYCLNCVDLNLKINQDLKSNECLCKRCQ